MTAWTSDELSKIGAAEELEHLIEKHWRGAPTRTVDAMSERRHYDTRY
jgi:hypothetical protein